MRYTGSLHTGSAQHVLLRTRVGRKCDLLPDVTNHRLQGLNMSPNRTPDVVSAYVPLVFRLHYSILETTEIQELPGN